MVGRVKTGDECTHEEPRRDFLFLFLLKFYGKWLLGEGWRRRRRGENKTDILYYNRPTHDRGSVFRDDDACCLSFSVRFRWENS